MTEYARNNIIIEFFAKLFQHILQNKKKYIPLHSLNRGNKSGEVVEWSITAVLKTVELRGSGGSNPSLSAINVGNQQITKQTPNFTPNNVKLGVFVLFKKTAERLCIDQ